MGVLAIHPVGSTAANSSGPDATGQDTRLLTSCPLYLRMARPCRRWTLPITALRTEYSVLSLESGPGVAVLQLDLLEVKSTTVRAQTSPA